MKFDQNNLLAARLESKEGGAMKAFIKYNFRDNLGEAEDTDIVALKNYMDAQHFGEIGIIGASTRTFLNPKTWIQEHGLNFIHNLNVEDPLQT
ncbi:Aspartic endopeptidase [Sarracenia purpurea var. burkii]